MKTNNIESPDFIETYAQTRFAATGKNAANKQTTGIQGGEQLDSGGYVEDKVDISDESKQKLRKTTDWKAKSEELRKEMRTLREELKRAEEAAEGVAEMWKIKIKCLQIAMRIMSGHEVPEADHRFLQENDMELYAKSIMLKKQRPDPDELDRISEEDKEDEENGEDGVSPDSAASDGAADAGEAPAADAGIAEDSA